MNAHLASFAEYDFVRVFALTSGANAAERVLHSARLDERVAHVGARELASIKLRFVFFAFRSKAFHTPSPSAPAFFVLRCLFERLLLLLSNLLLSWQCLLHLGQEFLDELSVDVRRPRQCSLRSIYFSDDFIIGCKFEQLCVT